MSILGTMYSSLMKEIFSRIFRTIVDGFSKPISAAIAVAWAYLATIQLNNPFGYDVFWYFYLPGQIVWFVFKKYFFVLLDESNRKEISIKKIIANALAGPLIILYAFLLFALVFFSYANIYLFFNGIIGLILPAIISAQLATVLTILLILLAFYEFEHNYSDYKKHEDKKSVDDLINEGLSGKKSDNPTKLWTHEVLEEK
ncbi:hypothetical protein HY989_01310 [Candidatus Micrarchaeota archaeon]|nr:hypothetical protein [Candidatus Micrarchaeota archaeon]